MPTPFPPVPPPGVDTDAPPGAGTGQQTHVRPQRHLHLREPQNWATEQERLRHDEALYLVGEWVFLILMWTQLDFDRGLVARCALCWSGGKRSRIAEVYKQPSKNECPDCFGTSFEGGYRARIIRPAMITDAEEAEKQNKRGSAHPAGVQVQTTCDFRTRPGDYMIRADGSRWRLSEAQRLQVHTGYGHPGQHDLGTSYILRAALEEIGSVAYLLPPETPTAMATLSRPVQLPADFEWGFYESIRGDLIPESIIN